MTPDDETRAVLEARYGVPPSAGAKRRRTILLVTLAVVAVAAFVVLALRATDSPVNTQDVAFRVIDDATAEVTFAVYQDPGQTAVCQVVVLNEGFGEVGVADVSVGPSPGETAIVRTEVTTTEPATGARIDGCRPTDG